MTSNALAVNARTNSRPAWLPWLLWAVAFLSSLAAVAFVVLNLPATHEPSDQQLSDYLNYLNGLIVACVGALIAWKRPENRIGWLALVAGILIGLEGLFTGYAIHALAIQHDTSFLTILADWVTQWLWIPAFLILTLVALLYPTGEYLSRRWRMVGWLAAANVAVMALLLALDDRLPVGGSPDAPLLQPGNPIGILSGSMIWPIVMAGFFVSSGLIILGLVSLVIRFRRSRGQERQQLKWFVYALALTMLFQVPSPFVQGAWLQVLDNAASVLVPIAIGIAILRYRLYDIDILINRTLVYVPLTAILAGLFAASITLSQKLFLLATGANSDAATVLTTLVVVAAFEPVKTGLQHLVDRRFKEAPDPTRRLKIFDREVQSFIQVADSNEITRRLLDETCAAFDATGGALFRGSNAKLDLARTAGEWNGHPALSVPLQVPETGSRIGELSLGPRRSGAEYTRADREILERTAQDVARAVLLGSGREPRPESNEASAVL